MKHANDKIMIGNDVPKMFRDRSALPSIDYIDMFEKHTKIVATPEEWARAMFGDVPDLGERFIWQVLLGLRINPSRSSDRVAGWKIAEITENWIRLEASSRIVAVNLVVSTDGLKTSLATFVHYNHTVGKLIWIPLSTVHRRLSPTLIQDASQKLIQSP